MSPVKLWTFNQNKKSERQIILPSPSKTHIEDLASLIKHLEKVKIYVENVSQAQARLQAQLSQNETDILPNLKLLKQQLQLLKTNIDERESETDTKITSLSDDLTEKIDEINNLIKEMKEKINVDFEIISTLVNGISNSMATLKGHVETDIGAFKKEIIQLKAEHEANLTDFEHFLELVENLNKSVNEKHTFLLKQMKEKFEELKKNNSKHIQDFSIFMDFMNKKNAKFLEEINSLKGSWEDKDQETTDKLTSMLGHIENLKENVLSKLQEWDSDSNIENLREKFNSDMDQMQQQYENVLDLTEQNSNKIENQKELFDTKLAEAVKTLKSESSSEEGQIQELLDSISGNTEKIENLETSTGSEIEKIKTTHQNLLDKHANEIDSIKTTTASDMSQLQELYDNVLNTASENTSKINNIINSPQVDVTEIEESIEAVATKNAELKKKVEEIAKKTENSNKELVTKNANLKNKIDEIARKTQDFNWRTTVVNQKISDLKGSMEGEINHIASNIVPGLMRKFEKLKEVQTKNTSSINDAGLRIINNSRSINESRASLQEKLDQSIDELRSDLRTNLDGITQDVDTLKEDIEDVKSGNFTIGTNTLSNTITEIRKQQQTLKKPKTIIQLYGQPSPLMFKGQKVLLHTGDDYKFYGSGKLVKLIIYCGVGIQAFINDSLLTVLYTTTEQPDGINLSKDIELGDTISFKLMERNAKGFYAEVWLELN